jgi:AraC-like DNA-binding protein
MAKQELPQAMQEMVERDGVSLDELAAHVGLSPSELADQYDLTKVTFRPKEDAAPAPDTAAS